MQVRELMTSDVVTAAPDERLRACVERMLREGVGSVVVVADGAHRGIVTESDALLAAYRTERPLGEIPARAAMSSPIERVSPSATALKAARRMEDAGVKKLAVVENLELRGIVTLSDVVEHLDSVHDEAREIARTRKRWNDSEHFR